MAGELIVLDAGHGGTDPGAVGGIIEKVYTLLYMLELALALRLLGFKVQLTRTTDVFLSLLQRSQIANSAGAAYFLSGHFNGGDGVGVETYAWKPGGTGERLAGLVQKYLVQYSGMVNRGVKFANYAVIGANTNAPAILTEFGFVIKDADKIKQQEYMRNYVRAVTRAFCEITNTPWRDVYAQGQISEGGNSVERYRIKVNGAQQNLMEQAPAIALYETLCKSSKPGDIVTLERESDGVVTSKFVVPAPIVPADEVTQLRARVKELEDKLAQAKEFMANL